MLMAMSVEDLGTALITRFVQVFLNLRDSYLAIGVYK